MTLRRSRHRRSVSRCAVERNHALGSIHCPSHVPVEIDDGGPPTLRVSAAVLLAAATRSMALIISDGVIFTLLVREREPSNDHRGPRRGDGRGGSCSSNHPSRRDGWDDCQVLVRGRW